MMSKINAKRKSHFGSVAFLFMLIDTAVSIFILAQTEYSTTYPGLLFSMLFFGGLSALLFSSYGMHPQLSALVLLLAVAPELVNIFVVNSSSYPAIVVTALCIVLAFEISYPKWLRHGLIIVGITVLQLTKLDELGTYFIDLAEGILSAMSIALLTFYLIYRYFDYASAQAKNNEVISPEMALDALREGIGHDFKYKFQPIQGEFLTAEGFQPIQKAMPLLAKWCAPGTLETIPIARLYLLDNVPVLETSNINLTCSKEGLAKLNLEIGFDGYELIRLDEERQGFVLVPTEYAQNWKRGTLTPTSTPPVENASVQSDEPAERIIGEIAHEEATITLDLDDQEVLTDTSIQDVEKQPAEVNGAESLEHDEHHSTKAQKVEQLNNAMEEFRQKRRFNPNAGRDMKRLRNITKEEGTDDFQWNVPSK